MNVIINSTTVIVRSMSIRKVDMYFDDGASGIPLGHLRLGQETSTNTYEGHVFYFTVSGNKDEEIARFTMNKDQVPSAYRTCSTNKEMP